MLRHRRGFEVEVPTVPLDHLYGEELQTWLQKHQVQLALNRCVQRIEVEERQVQQLSMRQGEPFKADWYITPCRSTACSICCRPVLSHSTMSLTVCIIWKIRRLPVSTCGWIAL